MQGSDQRRQLRLGHVLEFVEEHRQCGAGALRGGAGCREQGLQVVFEVAVVGQAGLGIEIQADLDIAELDLHRLGEACQCSQRTLSELRGLLVATQPQQRLAKLRRQQRRQRPALRRFDVDGVDAGRLGVFSHAVEQHRLADPSQADHQANYKRSISSLISV